MKHAIVDIGSNTVKMQIYHSESTGNFHKEGSVTKSAGLIRYIQDGKMSTEGIDLLCSLLKEFAQIAQQQLCDQFRCFATASLRRASNSGSVIRQVKHICNIDIDLISGEQEAQYSLNGILHEIGCKSSGIMLDMGGGSTETASFHKGVAGIFYSMPFGSLSLYQSLVHNILPTVEEAKQIATYAASEFRKSNPIPDQNLYVAGGTGRAICDIHAHLQGGASAGVYTLSKDEFLALKDHLLLCPNIENLLRQTVPDRFMTILPGLIALCAIADAENAQKVIFSTNGVREGYLLSII